MWAACPCMGCPIPRIMLLKPRPVAPNASGGALCAASGGETATEHRSSVRTVPTLPPHAHAHVPPPPPHAHAPPRAVRPRAYALACGGPRHVPGTSQTRPRHVPDTSQTRPRHVPDTSQTRLRGLSRPLLTHTSASRPLPSPCQSSWAPTVAGLMCIPLLPYLDPPAEHVIDAAFEYAWPPEPSPERA